MTWEGFDRRKFPRIEYPCLIRLGSSTESQALLAHTENIGEGGVCLIIKQSLPMFSVIDVELDLMDGYENLTAKGKVVWSVRRKALETVKPLFYDIGIEFVDLNEQQRTRLKDLVAVLIKKGVKQLKPYV